MTASIAALTAGGVVTTADSSGNLDIKSDTTISASFTATGVSIPGTLAATGKLTSAVGVGVPVRQTVLAGAVDTNGFPSFGGSTGSGTVTQTGGNLTVAAANGFAAGGQVDRVGVKSNPSWTGLTTNGTMFLGVTVNADGTLTEFSTTLAPTYRWGGADVTTSGQRTFNIQEMQMKVGNGATAAQAYDVFVGEVTVAGAVVTAIVWYALMGRYKSANTSAPAAATKTNFSHNIGTTFLKTPKLMGVCTTIDGGYSVGWIVEFLGVNTAAGIPAILVDRNTVAIQTGASGSSGLSLQTSTAGGTGVAVQTSWNVFVIAERAF